MIQQDHKFAYDALIPQQMALRAEDVGALKARMSGSSLFVLAVLAGAFIALGAVFSTTIITAALGFQSYGVTRLLAGLSFSLGLVLVVIGGAELFTGNNLIIIAWASGKVSTVALLRNWIIVYAGNLVGALGTVMMVYFSGQYRFGNCSVGAAALATAQAKLELGFVQAVVLGVLCNGLVCLAVWLTYSCRSTVDKIAAIVPPITAFVAAGFEHSIANMYFIPIALFIKAGADDSFWLILGKTDIDYPHLTWERFVVGNLAPVTLGNIIGGVVLVGAAYWFVYLRRPGNESREPGADVVASGGPNSVDK